MPQLTATLDRATSPLPPFGQSIAIPDQTITPAAPLSAPSAASSAQPDFSATSDNPISSTNRSTPPLTPDLSEDAAVLADYSGIANAPPNSPVGVEASPKPPEPPSAIGSVAPDAASAFPTLATQLSAPVQFSNPRTTASLAAANPPAFTAAMPPTNSAFNISSQPPSVPTPAPFPIVTPQSSVSDNHLVPLTAAPNAKPSADRSSADSEGANSSGLPVLAGAPSPTLSADATTVALGQSAASIAATTGDVADNAKPGLFARSAQSAVVAAPRTTAADKRPSATAPANITPVPHTRSAISSASTSTSGYQAALAAGKDTSVTLTAAAPPASASLSPTGLVSASELPQTHQMLDSAPPEAATLPPAPIAPGSAAELQMNGQLNAQMHVGLRTEAFGAVEIHTVVQRSQIGITVHADRDIARWFNSEVPGLESGLNKNHLNLAGVDFDHGRSGIQAATGFQQGQPRHSFSQTPGFPSAAAQEEDSAPQAAAIDLLPSGLSAGPATGHVSIHA